MRLVWAVVLIISSMVTAKADVLSQLKEDVAAAPYNISDYEMDRFDCSNMAALLHDWLELKGYDVKVFVGMGNIYGHIWLLVGGYKYVISSSEGREVVLKNNSYWVEPTGKTIFKDLHDVYGDFYDGFRITILDDYREFSSVSYQGLGFSKELGYKRYLAEKYGVDSLKELVEPW